MKGEIKPPDLGIRFLAWFCPSHLYEEIEGDLTQRFQRDVRMIGEGKAKRKFLWNVLCFFRPAILLRNKFSVELNQFSMLQSYFKIAVRHLMKGKSFSVINVGGLS